MVFQRDLVRAAEHFLRVARYVFPDRRPLRTSQKPRLWIVSVGRPSGSYLVDSHPKETRAIMRRSNLHSRDRPGLYSSARWQLQFEAWFTSPSLKTAVLG